MKIILCIKGLVKYVGGAERSLSELANELAQRGHDVVILNGENSYDASDKVFYQLHDRVKFINFYVNNKNRNAVRPFFKKVFNNRLLFVGLNNSEFLIRFLIIRISLSLNIFRRLADKVLKLRNNQGAHKNDYPAQYKKWLSDNAKELLLWQKHILEQHPDVVITFMHHVYLIVSQTLTNHSLPHIIVNRTDPVNSKFLYHDTFYKKLISLSAQKASFNIIQNEAFRAYFDQEQYDKTFVIPSPVDCVVNSTRQLNSVPEKLILSVGSFRNVKNHQLLILAFYKICHKYPDWKVSIYGEDLGLKDELQHMITKLDLQNQVTLSFPKHEIANIYRRAAIFAMPSLFEGFSRALGEAISFGLPCLVIKDCISNTEIVRIANCGLIAKNSPIDFAEKLENLILNAGQRVELGKNGINYAQNFNPEKIYNQWEKLISEAAKNKHTVL